MGRLGELSLSSFEMFAWCTQLSLMGLLAFGRGGLSLRQPTMSFCLLVIALGWIWRLGHGFVLVASGHDFWIGDDPLRWLLSWLWHQDPYLARPNSNWLGGTYYLHGSAMGLMGDPLVASKLVSVFYPVLPLIGLFVFAQAIFGSRVLSIGCVMVATPSWIDILLSTGTMAEMPTAGFALAGGGFTIMGLREGKGRRRGALLCAGALGFAGSTMFHLSMWPQLAAVLSLLLPIWLARGEAPLGRRLVGWLAFCAVSTAYCFAWTGQLWWLTGSPFSAIANQSRGANVFYKIGGESQVPQILLERLGSLGGTLLLLGGLAMLSGLALWWIPRSSSLAAASLRDRFPSLLPRHFRRGALASLSLAILFGLSGTISIATAGLDIPADELERFWVNVGVYPTALLYSVKYLLPLIICGVALTFLRGFERAPAARLVLLFVSASFSMLIVTAALGGANLTPFRTVLPVATALIPFAVAPLFLEPGSFSPHARPRDPARSVSAALAILILLQLGVSNHRRILAELPAPEIIRNGFSGLHTSDLAALGAWLRSEVRYPLRLTEENLAQGFEVVITDVARIRAVILQYLVGDPGRFARNYESPIGIPALERIVSGLSPNQILITDRDLDDESLQEVAHVASYRIYQKKAR